ncbi:serine--tRNA ligase [Desulfolutivibrio sulfoxidireducens]|uniref:serine--tRNA ligase n=1 Tax=Desulfolutivibrio sulfoxidireducens TaxID=2773299 RepID=UPI00159D64F0|nr:serine--tRNA ligase [Desulfolutivibrio sulfoxidireducens]QLA17747.1 serine--tRNA ligase [Desulfolutivibrio sulfoxidireducens]QLA21323.1 serine--tRNA ligase [Desulfolutivibrio sulfoxidireducens]
MLDLKYVRQNFDAVRQALSRRGPLPGLDAFLEKDAVRRDLLTRSEALKAERNRASAEVATAKREGRDVSNLLAGLGRAGDEIKALDAALAEVDAAVRDILTAVPNIPHPSTPDGRDERDNRVERTFGEPRTFDFPVRDHLDVGAGLSGLDFERAARMSGARFCVLRGDLARLERALVAFMIDLHTYEHGYLEIAPPYLVTGESLFGTGQLPKFAEDLFKIEGQDRYLIPTAEVPLTNLHRGETLAEEALPLAYAAFTPCFRSEAGSYGRDTRGLIRLHQFDKVELVRVCRPEDSYQELEKLTGHAEEVLRRLDLPYRVVSLCAGDLGFGAARTFDLEVWLPGQDTYREISSCSNFEDFQARRADIRIKAKGAKKTVLAHTLNGSGLAVGRTMAAILENFQNADGSVTLPAALAPYMGGRERLEPSGR